MTDATPTSPKPKRRSPISREEGERRLVAATIELLHERPMGEIGVRDIAQRADVNHGFVHVWFGGKTPLLTRALHELIAGLVRNIQQAPAGSFAAQPFDPEVMLVVRLVMWISLESGETPDMNGMQVIETLTRRYVELEGLRPDVASIAAKQAVASAIAASMYGPLIGVTSNESAVEMFSQWRHTLGLLAKYPPA